MSLDDQHPQEKDFAFTEAFT